MKRLLFSVVSSRPGVTLRSQLRRSEVGRALLRAIAARFNRNYEQPFHDAIVAALRPGDIVWDIGANVGLYTRLFLKAVGPSGSVVAVEPSPASADACRALTDSSDHRLVVVEAAISDRPGAARLAVHHATATYNRLETNDGDVETQEVRVVTGDIILAETNATPTLVKIDVEGFELKALGGMAGVLAEPQLRTLFVEVHFGHLEAEGVADAPRQIEALLSPFGFTLDWVSFGHVVARRKTG